ncbi:MAG: 5-formyltetrahydrofolate cyclo-ligase [Clostridia bacterium]|nr:5-formyltetrahydrofolate cyclo-ligase [Clostridia bacterium]
MNKQELRKKYLSLRDSFSQKERKESGSVIFDKIKELKEYKNCSLLLVYCSFGSEPDTAGIIDDALSRGKSVAVPRITGKKMEFVLLNSRSELTLGKYNILTAPENREPIKDFSNALCIVPCISIDFNLNRLGYGGGYYDRFLSENNSIKTVCVCFDRCISSSLPKEEYDVAVDMCVTESRIIGGETDAGR